MKSGSTGNRSEGLVRDGRPLFCFLGYTGGMRYVTITCTNDTIICREEWVREMLKNNIEVSTISSILGHSSVDVTNIYLSIDEEQLRKLALEVPVYE